MSALGLGWHIMSERLTAGRMAVIWVLLAILVLFASWGFTDSNLNLTSNYQIESAYDVIFVSTAATIWGSTLGAVLISSMELVETEFREFWKLSYHNQCRERSSQLHYYWATGERF